MKHVAFCERRKEQSNGGCRGRAVAAGMTAPRGLRATLRAGGVLLIAVGTVRVILLVPQDGVWGSGLSWVGIVLNSAALCVFAFGIRRGGSIVAGRLLGVVALVILAIEPFIEAILYALVPYTEQTAGFHLSVGLALQAILLMAAIVAVMQIARVGVLTGWIRWVPLWALCPRVAPQVLFQVVAVSAGSEDFPLAADPLIALSSLSWVAVPLTLGILAVVRSSRGERPAVPVFDSVRPSG